MSCESPTNNDEGEGSKNGRKWTNAEVFAFISFLNQERNDGALRNTTAKFMAPTLKKASEHMGVLYPQRDWKYNTTLRSQFKRIRDDWRIFKEILDASGTEWHPDTKCFTISDAQREGFVAKHGARGGQIIDGGILTNDYITIDTYINIFSDDPDAGRKIYPIKLAWDHQDSLDANDDGVDVDHTDNDDSDELELVEVRTKQSKKKSRSSTATPKPSRVTKATSTKKTPKAKPPKKVKAGTAANGIANARLRDPESQNHSLALIDAAKDDHGFAPSLTTAILIWIQDDPKNNAAFWMAPLSITTKLRCLRRKPGFEEAEFPEDLTYY